MKSCNARQGRAKFGRPCKNCIFMVLEGLTKDLRLAKTQNHFLTSPRSGIWEVFEKVALDTFLEGFLTLSQIILYP